MTALFAMPAAHSKPLARGGRDGFTLVEVLVAFTILAILAIAVQQGVSTAIGGMRRADSRIGAEMVARTLLTGPLGSGPTAAAPRRGRMNGFDWTISFAPLAVPLAAGGDAPVAARWTPLRMIVAVSRTGASQSSLKVETIRLLRLGT